ncbi:MAG: ankyrin repeat domain-containing protein [Planctomycetota bacterium]|jgi:hypothetical protein
MNNNLSEKSNIVPWRSISLILFVFVPLMCGMLAWTPMKLRIYTGSFYSDDTKERIAGIDGFVSMGRNGLNALAGEIEGGYEAAELLFKCWKNVNEKNSDGMTGLHLAAMKGYREATELLLAHGADIDAKDDKRRTPIYLAAENTRIRIAKLLIGKKAKINSYNCDGYNPLDAAEKMKHLEMKELLVSHGAEMGPGPRRI